jgi:CarboxypepD_reg-like domain
MTAMFVLGQFSPQAIPAIIHEASTSPLGIFALMLIALAGISYFFFKREKTGAKLVVLAAMFVGVAFYGTAIVRSMPSVQTVGRVPDGGGSKLDSTLTIDGTVIDANDNRSIAQAEVGIAGSANRTITDSSGSFHLVARDMGNEESLDLRVSRKGYATLDWQVKPPLRGLVVPLQKQ